MEDNKHYIIWESEEYDKFVRDHNRPVNQKHVDELVESMKEYGFLSEFPIIVRPLGDGKFAITDGQHRHAAARVAEVKVAFVITQRIKRHDVPKLASGVRPWKIEDWLGIYLDEHKEEYQRLDHFRRKYADLPISLAAGLCFSGQTHMSKEAKTLFESGEFVCTSIDRAEAVMSLASKFNGPMSKHWNRKNFVQALLIVTNDPRYDEARMIVRLKHAGTFVQPHLRAKDYLEPLSDMYNYKVPPEKKVMFTSHN